MASVQYLLQKTRTVPIGGGGRSDDQPNVPSTQYGDLEASWELTTDLLSGTQGMREKGERWLPREPGEQVNMYRVRLSRSFLYNCLRDTIEKLVAKPFSQPVSVAPDELDDDMLDQMVEDVDGSGLDLTELGRALFADMCTLGKCHVLTDYPVSSTDPDPKPNLAQEKSSGVRPVAIRVDPRDLIGWRSRKGANGELELSQVRIAERKWESIGLFGEVEVCYVRVINAPPAGDQADPATGEKAKGTWQLYKRSSNGRYEVDSEGTHTFPGVPLRTAYANKTGFMMAAPPLQDLAELNLAHWQSYSDQRNILRFSRMAMLAMTGISAEDYEKQTTIAPNNVLKSQNPDAQYYYVEHSGAAIGAGRDDIKDLEDRMQVLGLQPLVQSNSDSTAFGKAADENKNETIIQSWIRALECLLEGMFEDAAQWVGAELPEDFRIDIFSDFGISMNGTADADVLLRARAQKEITQETFLREMKRRGVLSDGLDVEQEIDTLATEPPDIDPSLMGFPGAPGPVGPPGKPGGGPQGPPAPQPKPGRPRPPFPPRRRPGAGKGA